MLIFPCILYKNKKLLQEMALLCNKTKKKSYLCNWKCPYNGQEKETKMDNNTRKQINEENSHQIQCNTYVYIAPGSINIGNIENLYTCDPPSKTEVTKNEGIISNSEAPDIERVLQIIGQMARDGMFRKNKHYFAVYKITEERYAPGMTTQTFCEIMKLKTDLPPNLLPRNGNIRRISIKKGTTYPDWKFSMPDDTKCIPVFLSLASELLRRLR